MINTLSNLNSGDKGSPSAQPSVGSTVATDMGDAGKDFHPSIRSSVSSTLSFLRERVPNASSEALTIAESLLIPFLARRSNRAEMFSVREFGRFRESFVRTLQTLTKYQSNDCREQTFTKFWIDTYLAQVFRDTITPPREEWIEDSLFSGWCRKTIKRAIARRDIRFIFSLQKGSKQMWPPLKEPNLRAAIQKSIDRLTQSKPPSEPIVLSTVREVSRRVFRGIDFRLTNVGTKFMPSESACSQASVLSGGNLSLFAPMEHPTSQQVSQLGNLRALTTEISKWRQREFEFASTEATKVWPHDHGNTQLFVGNGRVYSVDDDPRFDVRWVPIFEPGKIRSVSVGDGFVYTTLQPLQGQMLESWKQTRNSTMLLQNLEPRINDLLSGLPGDWLWCSGDYEAATDLVNRDVTLSALEGVPYHPLTHLASSSFNRGWVGHPDLRAKSLKKADLIYRPLLEGQLMGHPLSFPLLCVINKAVLLLSCRRWVWSAFFPRERRFRTEMVRKIMDLALINGDDILFRGTSELIDIFRVTSAQFGLKISIGKNYVSPDTAMINSQVFTKRGNRMVRMGYLNLRLVKGVNVKARTAAGESVVDPSHLGRNLGEMYRDCPWAVSTLAMSFDRWKEKSKDFRWFQPNWFLPVHLGGYGVPLRYANPDWRITRSQRLLAAAFVSDPELVLYRVGGFKLPNFLRKVGTLNFRVVVGDYVLNSHEVEVQSENGKIRDEWLERFAYAEQAMAAGNSKIYHNPRKEGVNDFETYLVANRIKRDYRLKPMSAEGIVSHWKLRLVTVRGPVCPPLNSLHWRPLTTSVESMLFRQEFFLDF